MREISAGVYNILKSHNARPMSAGNMMSKLEVIDQHLEANLCTMLQTVRGTTQFWFTKQGELRCMVWEWNRKKNWGGGTILITITKKLRVAHKSTETRKGLLLVLEIILGKLGAMKKGSDKKTFTINEKSKDLGLLKKLRKQERLRGDLLFWKLFWESWELFGARHEHSISVPDSTSLNHCLQTSYIGTTLQPLRYGPRRSRHLP